MVAIYWFLIKTYHDYDKNNCLKKIVTICEQKIKNKK